MKTIYEEDPNLVEEIMEWHTWYTRNVRVLERSLSDNERRSDYCQTEWTFGDKYLRYACWKCNNVQHFDLQNLWGFMVEDHIMCIDCMKQQPTESSTWSYVFVDFPIYHDSDNDVDLNKEFGRYYSYCSQCKKPRPALLNKQ